MSERDGSDQRAAARERRLVVAVALNLLVVVAQAVFGIVARSLGLLSDAGHNLTDVAALVLSLVAIRLARRSPTPVRSYGWQRGTILAAQANSAMLLLVTVWIAWEAIRRLIDPVPVQGGIVLVVATIAFVANGASALLVREQHDDGDADLNMRSALLHLASDALASLGVAVAGAIMWATGGFTWLDPAVSLVIGVAIAVQAWRLLVASNAILLEGAPAGLDPAEVSAAIAALDGVEGVHHLHAWALSSDLRALSVHVIVAGHPSLEDAQHMADRIRAHLAGRFRIAHATIELECEPCDPTDPTRDVE